MGLDILLHAEADPSPERLTAAEKVFHAAVGVADRYEGHWSSLEIDSEDWYPRPRVIANLTQRYYGEGYERGDWPSIYVAIQVFRHLFPEAEVFYGSDSSDDGELVTDDMLREVWRHYLGPDGNAYHERWNR